MATEFVPQGGVQDAASHGAGLAGPPLGAGAAVASSGAVDGAGTYAQRAAIDDATCETIRQANAAFLALVARRAASDTGPAALGIPAAIAARIAAQDATTRRFAAECPYTLFNVRFEDATFWRSLARVPGPLTGDGLGARVCAVDVPRAQAAVVGDEPRFVLTAVFLAWHLARHGDLCSALVLGMTPAVRDVWRGMPLQALDAVAAVALPQLRARWGAHPRFWPQLLAAAERPGLDHAERVRLLGLQLLATDGCRTSLSRRPRRPA